MTYAARSLLLTSFALLAVLSCATPEATLEEQQAYNEAVAPLPDRPDEAAELLEAFLQRYRTSPLSEEAAFQRARIALDQGDRPKAAFWLGWLVRNHPRGDSSDLARLELAQLQLQLGDVGMAQQVLRGLRDDRLTPADQRTAYRLRAEIAGPSGAQVYWLARARETAQQLGLSPEAMALLDAEIDAAVDGLGPEELSRAADRLDGRPPAARVALRLAQALLERGEADSAVDEIDVARSLPLGDSDSALLEEVLLRLELFEQGQETDGLLPSFQEVAELGLPSRAGATGTVGAVLPLTGPYALFGEDALRAILLAAGVYGTDESSADELPPRVRVVVRDSAGDPLRAAAAVRELARDEDVVAIVGPLRAATSESAARAAEEEGIPLIALTTRESVPRERAWVFRVGTTPEDELRYLVEHAFGPLEAKRYAVLYPDDAYGRGMRDHFWRMVEERGGYVVGASAYDPDSTDFGDPIREMIGYSLLTPREQAALAERERFERRGRRLRPVENAGLAREIAEDMIGPEGVPLPPIVDFDALFIPDHYEKLKVLLPQLAFNQLTDVQLLGAGNWNDPSLIEVAREHVSGAVISARFDPESRFEFVADFAGRYREAFAAEPDAFSAHAYDAASVVIVQLARGFDTRDAVRDGILRTQVYPGASGVMSVGPDGNARKRPFLLQVRGRRIVSLD